MKPLILAVGASLALSACAPGLLAGLGGPVAPAPLAATTIDDRGLEIAWKAFDLALDGINVLGDFGIIKPGTPEGRAVAKGIRAVNTALATAERAASGLSTTNYAQALEDANTALQGLRDTVTALKGGK